MGKTRKKSAFGGLARARRGIPREGDAARVGSMGADNATADYADRCDSPPARFGKDTIWLNMMRSAASMSVKYLVNLANLL